MTLPWAAGLGLLSALLVCARPERAPPESPLLPPKVMIAILVRNAAHSLPFYLGCVERLEYPRDRLALWVAVDHSVDNSTAMVLEWLKSVQAPYHYVEWRPQEEPRSYADESGPKHWSRSRFDHVMKLRQAALKAARKQWADYLLFADADNLLTNPRLLTLLMAENLTLVAPMLESHTLYSNFWCGMTAEGYYERTPDYVPVRQWRRAGCFPVPMVHSTFLVDLRRTASRALAFHPPHPDYRGAFDDIMVFAFSAHKAGIQMHVCNRERYGFLPVPLKPQQSLEDEEESCVHTITEAMVDHALEPSRHLHTPPKAQDTIGFDQVFLINLRRRTQRRERMLRTLAVLGIQATPTDAVDGKALNGSQLEALGVAMLPGYRDPYSGRELTRGEVGCFLSHHHIWTQVRGLRQVLVLEDDVRFEPRFKSRLRDVMRDVAGLQLDWDLIYVGRKRLQERSSEKAVQGARNLVEAGYSYWTLGYALSLGGARKLLQAEPLGRMLPVDEFLPVMFDKHPKQQYLEHFEPRDLRAFSVEPLLLFPTHYTGEPGYVSDTETSTIWDDEAAGTDWDREHTRRRWQEGQGRLRPPGPNSAAAADSHNEL
uniref:Procollagen galactosyltransferase 2-like n=1 Tax=Scleropages formosus TaxID=113540 RepID=A0A8C9TBH8_SCLFO